MSEKILTIMLIFAIILNVFSFGLFMSQKIICDMNYQMWEYACNDGCSRATLNDNGFPTNETFECWKECKIYINEVKGETR